MKVNHFIPEKNPKGDGGGEKVEKSWKWITERAGKSIIIVNLNQSLLLQKDSRFVFIGAHAYNLKKKKKKKGDGATEPWPQIFILSEKKREKEREKSERWLQKSAVECLQRLWWAVHKKSFESLRFFSDGELAHTQAGREAANIHRLLPALGRRTHTHTPSFRSDVKNVDYLWGCYIA